MAGGMQRVDLKLQEKLLVEVVSEILEKMYGLKLSLEPAVKRNHIKWNEKYRMVAKGKDKGYYDGSQVACINYFLTEKHMVKNITCGSVIVYLDNYHLKDFFEAVGIPKQEISNAVTVKDFCGELCNMIASNMINRLGRAGFVDPIMATPVVSSEEIPDGVVFNRDFTEYLEFSFFVWNKNVLTVDLTLSEIQTKT